jgi:hypothetical protein
MIQAMAANWRGPKGRQRLLALAASTSFHVLLLAAIGLGLTQTRFETPIDEPPPLYLDLTPRPLLPDEVARRPTRPQAVSTGREAAAASSARALPDILEERPSPPAPRLAPPAPQGLSGPAAEGPVAGSPAADPWRFRPQDMRGAVARSLRLGAAGCRTMDGQLPAGEQQFCDERFNAGAAEAARRHPPGGRSLTPSEARREAQFAREGAAAMARYERRRSGPGPGTGVAGAAPECVGGNLRGTCPGAHLAGHYQHQEEAPFGGSARPK